MSTIQIEDLDVQIASSEGFSSRSDTYPTIPSGVTHLKYKDLTYEIKYANNSIMLLFEEMLNNPAFSCVPIYGMEERITYGFYRRFISLDYKI